MNYVSALYAILLLIICADWFMRARKEFRGRVGRREGVAAAAAATTARKGKEGLGVGEERREEA